MTHTDADPHAGGAARRKLPIGIQTFRKIREDGCYYVDKTARAQRLVDEVARTWRSTAPGAGLAVDGTGRERKRHVPPFACRVGSRGWRTASA